MLCWVSVPYFGSKWLRDDTIGAVDPVMLGKLTTEDGRGIDTTGALPMPVDFLQRDDVGVSYLGRDARKIVSAVLAEPKLNVVRDELHASGEFFGDALRPRCARRAAGRSPLVEAPTDTSTCAMFINFASCQRQIHELFSGARVGQLYHAAVRRQNQLCFRQVAEGFVSALDQRFHTFNFVLTDIKDSQHDDFFADCAQNGNIQVTRRPLYGNDIQLGLGQPSQDITVIVLIRLVADAFSLQRLIG